MSAVVPQASHGGRDDHGPGPFTCIHCHGVFSTWARLTFHLAVCKSRSYPRKFTIGKHLFVVHLNPLKKYVMALKRLAENPKMTEVAFVGALLVLKEAGHIHSYEIEPLQTPPPGPPTPAVQGTLRPTPRA